MIIEILMAAGVIMLASLSGVAFVHGVARQFLEERLSFLVSFSAGVFLVTAGALTLEVFEIFSLTLATAIGLILSGYGLAWVLETLVPESHHHHDPACADGHTHGRAGATKLLVGDAIHNIGDGIILVPAFLVSPALGIAVTVSVFIHETLQEISEFFVLKQAGFSTARALMINFAISSTILVGVGLSYFAVVTHELEGILLAVSAGFFLHVVIHDLLPKRAQHETVGAFMVHVGLVALGLGLMALVNLSLGEQHAHSEADGVSDEHVGGVS